MKINELEQIIEKLRYYGVDKEIENISEYLKNLTQVEIDNILSMDYSKKNIYINAKRFDYLKIFNNHKLLNSSEFNKILDVILVEFLKKYQSLKHKSGIARWDNVLPYHNLIINFYAFYEILESKAAWDGGYILDDIERICAKMTETLAMIPKFRYVNGDYDKDEVLEFKKEISKSHFMQKLATNEISLNKSSHSIAMEEIRDAKSVAKAEAIYDIQTSNNFKAHSPYKYFRIIDRAKTDKVVEYLKDLILSDYLVDEELEIIVSAHNDKIAEILYTVAKTIINSDDYDGYTNTYLDDLIVIARTENIEIAQELAKLATSLKSLKNHKHSNQMRMISGINDVQKAKTLVNVALKNKGHYDDLDVIMYNAQSYVDENGYDTELPSNIFKINKKHNNKK